MMWEKVLFISYTKTFKSRNPPILGFFHLNSNFSLPFFINRSAGVCSEMPFKFGSAPCLSNVFTISTLPTELPFVLMEIVFNYFY